MPTFSFEIPELQMVDDAEYTCEMDGVEVGRGKIIVDGELRVFSKVSYVRRDYIILCSTDVACP